MSARPTLGEMLLGVEGLALLRLPCQAAHLLDRRPVRAWCGSARSQLSPGPNRAGRET